MNMGLFHLVNIFSHISFIFILAGMQGGIGNLNKEPAAYRDDQYTCQRFTLSELLEKCYLQQAFVVFVPSFTNFFEDDTRTKPIVLLILMKCQKFATNVQYLVILYLCVQFRRRCRINMGQNTTLHYSIKLHNKFQ